MDSDDSTRPSTYVGGGEATVSSFITLIIVLAGVLGGLIIVIIVILVCKYCVKAKKPSRRSLRDGSSSSGMGEGGRAVRMLQRYETINSDMLSEPSTASLDGIPLSPRKSQDSRGRGRREDTDEVNERTQLRSSYDKDLQAEEGAVAVLEELEAAGGAVGGRRASASCHVTMELVEGMEVEMEVEEELDRSPSPSSLLLYEDGGGVSRYTEGDFHHFRYAAKLASLSGRVQQEGEGVRGEGGPGSGPPTRPTPSLAAVALHSAFRYSLDERLRILQQEAERSFPPLHHSPLRRSPRARRRGSSPDGRLRGMSLAEDYMTDDSVLVVEEVEESGGTGATLALATVATSRSRHVTPSPPTTLPRELGGGRWRRGRRSRGGTPSASPSPPGEPVYRQINVEVHRAQGNQEPSLMLVAPGGSSTQQETVTEQQADPTTTTTTTTTSGLDTGLPPSPTQHSPPPPPSPSHPPRTSPSSSSPPTTSPTYHHHHYLPQQQQQQQQHEKEDAEQRLHHHHHHHHHHHRSSISKPLQRAVSEGGVGGGGRGAGGASEAETVPTSVPPQPPTYLLLTPQHHQQQQQDRPGAEAREQPTQASFRHVQRAQAYGKRVSHSLELVGARRRAYPGTRKVKSYEDVPDYDVLQITEFSRGPFYNTDYDVISELASPTSSKVRYNDTGSLEELAEDTEAGEGATCPALEALLPPLHPDTPGDEDDEEDEDEMGGEFICPQNRELWMLRATLEEEEECSDTVRMEDVGTSPDESPQREHVQMLPLAVGPDMISQPPRNGDGGGPWKEKQEQQEEEKEEEEKSAGAEVGGGEEEGSSPPDPDMSTEDGAPHSLPSPPLPPPSSGCGGDEGSGCCSNGAEQQPATTTTTTTTTVTSTATKTTTTTTTTTASASASASVISAAAAASQLLHPNYEKRRQSYRNGRHRSSGGGSEDAATGQGNGRHGRGSEDSTAGQGSGRGGGSGGGGGGGQASANNSVDSVDTDGDVSDTSRQEVTSTSFESNTDNTDSTTESQHSRLRQMKTDSGYKSLETQQSGVRDPGDMLDLVDLPGDYIVERQESQDDLLGGELVVIADDRAGGNGHADGRDGGGFVVVGNGGGDVGGGAGDDGSRQGGHHGGGGGGANVARYEVAGGRRNSNAVHFERRAGRTASKKRREYSRERQVIHVYESVLEPEEAASASQESMEDDGTLHPHHHHHHHHHHPHPHHHHHHQQPQAAPVSKRSVFTRFFSQARDPRDKYMVRDYSIDEKTNQIFNEFLRQEPSPGGGGEGGPGRGEGGARLGLRRSPRSQHRSRMQRKHTDPLYRLEDRRGSDRLVPEIRSSSMGSDSSVGSLRRLSPQDSIEEEFEEEEGEEEAGKKGGGDFDRPKLAPRVEVGDGEGGEEGEGGEGGTGGSQPLVYPPAKGIPDIAGVPDIAAIPEVAVGERTALPDNIPIIKLPEEEAVDVL